MATIRDVAKAAGVSGAAVSYYLNGTARISEATGKRIQRAVKTLGYRPDPLARSLSMGKREVVGLAALMGSRPYTDLVLSEIVAGVADAAAELGWSIHYLPIREGNGMTTWPARLLDAVAGTLVLDWAGQYAPWQDIRKGKHPVVLLNAARKGTISVEVDNEEGGRLAASHVMLLGHKRVAVFSAEGPIENARACGAMDEFKRGGAKADVCLTQSSGERARAVFRRLMTRRPAARPTAVFAVSDWMAMAVLDEARKMGLRVPFDLSVVGYDDSILAEVSGPPLTTIHQPLREMGRAGFAALQRMLKGERAVPARLPVKLVVRGSSCMAPATKGRGL